MEICTYNPITNLSTDRLEPAHTDSSNTRTQREGIWMFGPVTPRLSFSTFVRMIISLESDGSFFASIPQLRFHGTGITVSEAVDDLFTALEDYYDLVIRKAQDSPRYQRELAALSEIICVSSAI